MRNAENGSKPANKSTGFCTITKGNTMKRTLLIASSVLLSVQVQANEIYEWVGMPEVTENMIMLDSSSSGAGGLADIVGLALWLPSSGLTTFTPGSPSMTLGTGFAWNPMEITSVSLTFTTPQLPWDGPLGHTITWYDVTIAANQLSIYFHNSFSGGTEQEGYYVNDLTGAWKVMPLASVPDGGSTGLLLLGTMAGLAGWRRRA